METHGLLRRNLTCKSWWLQSMDFCEAPYTIHRNTKLYLLESYQGIWITKTHGEKNSPEKLSSCESLAPKGFTFFPWRKFIQPLIEVLRDTLQSELALILFLFCLSAFVFCIFRQLGICQRQGQYSACRICMTLDLRAIADWRTRQSHFVLRMEVLQFFIIENVLKIKGI